MFFKKHPTKLAIASGYGNVKLWNVENAKCVRSYAGHSPYSSIFVVKYLTGSRLASGSGDSKIKIWSLSSDSATEGECIRTLVGHSRAVYSLVQIDHALLASGSGDFTIRTWNMNTGECMRTLVGHAGSVYALELVADQRIVSGSADKTLKIWNTANGVCTRTLLSNYYWNRGPMALSLLRLMGTMAYQNWIFAIRAVSSDKFASGSGDEIISIWHLHSGECVRTLSGHTGAVSALELVGPQRLASGSWDRTIRLWNVENGECLRVLFNLNHSSGKVHSLAMVSASRMHLASGIGKTIKIWCLTDGEVVASIAGAEIQGTVMALDTIKNK